MAAVASGAHTLAGTLLTSLTAGVNFTIPTVNLSAVTFTQPATTGPLYAVVAPISFDDLTTGVVGGTGVFDQLMVSLVSHLKIEYAANRISGAEYTKAYVGIITAALQTAQQFLLSKDQAYWQALLVQAQARAADVELIKARVDLEGTRVNLVRAQFEAATTEVNYGLTKMKISTEDATYANLVLQGDNLAKQTLNLTKQGQGLDYTNDFILPEQKKLLSEQSEVQRAQTMNSRSVTGGGGTIEGLIGSQKDLYAQQIISYKRDAETKAVKIWADAYVTQMTVLDGVTTPFQFNQDNINEVLAKLKNNLALNT